MSGITACVVATVMFARAPVPPEAAPDPLSRGYMGITVQTGALTIERVEPGLPASKAGVRPGDVIVRVGTLEPRAFEEVVAHICSFRPGAVVELEVQRGSERKTFKVKLGVRPVELDLTSRFPNPPIIIDP